MAGFFSRLFGLKDNVDFNALIKKGATIVDVRSSGECQCGSLKQAINIPLESLNSKLSKINKSKPVIVVCASGMRSKSAVSILKANGYTEVYNGGSWCDLLPK